MKTKRLEISYFMRNMVPSVITLIMKKYIDISAKRGYTVFTYYFLDLKR